MHTQWHQRAAEDCGFPWQQYQCFQRQTQISNIQSESPGGSAALALTLELLGKINANNNEENGQHDDITPKLCDNSGILIINYIYQGIFDIDIDTCLYITTYLHRAYFEYCEAQLDGIGKKN